MSKSKKLSIELAKYIFAFPKYYPIRILIEFLLYKVIFFLNIYLIFQFKN